MPTWPKLGANLGSTWAPRGVQNREKRLLKIISFQNPQTDPNMTPKWPQNDPNMTPKWDPKWHPNDSKMIPKWIYTNVQKYIKTVRRSRIKNKGSNRKSKGRPKKTSRKIKGKQSDRQRRTHHKIKGNPNETARKQKQREAKRTTIGKQSRKNRKA